jgi:hypothetical protein
VDSLVVRRARGDEPHIRLVGRSANLVAKLYRIDCTSPPVGGNYAMTSCPAGTFMVYHLSFFDRSRYLLTLTARAEQCMWMYRGDRVFVGQPYWTTVKFWKALAAALGVSVRFLTPSQPLPRAP